MTKAQKDRLPQAIARINKDPAGTMRELKRRADRAMAESTRATRERRLSAVLYRRTP